jgi:hypothetical protein
MNIHSSKKTFQQVVITNMAGQGLLLERIKRLTYKVLNFEVPWYI